MIRARAEHSWPNSHSANNQAVQSWLSGPLTSRKVRKSSSRADQSFQGLHFNFIHTLRDQGVSRPTACFSVRAAAGLQLVPIPKDSESRRPVMFSVVTSELLVTREQPRRCRQGPHLPRQEFQNGLICISIQAFQELSCRRWCPDREWGFPTKSPYA
jgi:hypothetical protein